MAADALEQSVLESKDREQLMAIASALGVKSTSRAKKADLIQKILEQTGALPLAGSTIAAKAASAQASLELDGADTPVVEAARPARSSGRTPAPKLAPAQAARADGPRLGADGEPLADWEIELLEQGISTETQPVAPSPGSRSTPARPAAPRPAANDRDGDVDGDAGDDGDDGDDADGSDGADGQDGDGESRNRRRRRRRNKNRGDNAVEGGEQPRPDAAPRADAPRDNGNQRDSGAANGNQRDNNGATNGNQRDGNQRDVNQRDGNSRNRNERFERFEREDTTSGLEPVPVSGYLDLRDEGYGFLRVNGYLPSRDDSYIPVKLTRQFGLRRGDHITGLSRPAGRNEKNPALLEVHTVNGGEPDKARERPRFDELTPLFPATMLRLETPGSSRPENMTARIIDLISPIGLGQRGIIVAPPKAGKTAIMKIIATAIEQNHPTVHLMVLLIDERPEEVTDMRRTVNGEVIASTFDRPSDEHTHTAEMVIEKAKRLVEQGEDVVVLLDGITRLIRAYNVVGSATGRIMSGGLDAGALYPPKKLFGAARNVEEGGSLTILATALVETNSGMDDAIFEEFRGAANMELRLDRYLAERRIYPAIDLDESSTSHEELLFTPTQLERVRSMRRDMSDRSADGGASGVELLIERLTSSRTNDELFA
ncbi:MAG: transcription termination factor Rho [Ilumatobacteraceae bacterium]